jgi:hypothetical protein
MLGRRSGCGRRPAGRGPETRRHPRPPAFRRRLQDSLSCRERASAPRRRTRGWRVVARASRRETFQRRGAFAPARPGVILRVSASRSWPNIESSAGDRHESAYGLPCSEAAGKTRFASGIIRPPSQQKFAQARRGPQRPGQQPPRRTSAAGLRACVFAPSPGASRRPLPQGERGKRRRPSLLPPGSGSSRFPNSKMPKSATADFGREKVDPRSGVG